MIADAAAVLALVLVGLLAGNELGTLAVVQPALDRAPYDAGRPAAQGVVARYGRVMPVFMPLTVVIVFAAAALLGGTPGVLAGAAGVLLVAMLVVTFVGLMPLNRRQLDATEATDAGQWRAWRGRWLRLHSIRVVCDTGAFVLVAVAAVAA